MSQKTRRSRRFANVKASQFYDLFSPFFRNVNITEMTGNVNAKCENVKRIPGERIEEALRFEFDLPYSDGSKMGLVDEAISAFRKRFLELLT